MSLLIIDDDAAFCEALAGTVTGLGHEAVQAASAEEGIKLLTTRRCDAIFLDYRMPGMSGIDALPLLMESVSQPPPVVMLTAYADVDNTIKAMKLGAFDHAHGLLLCICHWGIPPAGLPLPLKILEGREKFQRGGGREVGHFPGIRLIER